MRILAVVAALLCPPVAANAQAAPAFPEWDARAHCDRQNRILAIESAVMLRACIDQEERAATMLRRDWESATPASRRTCLSQQEMMRMTSYNLLNACVQMERDATRDLQRRP